MLDARPRSFYSVTGAGNDRFTSARTALEKYETYVQQKSGLTKIGTDLMANAFNENGPAVKVADVTSDRGKGLQMGFKFISMGAMSFWRTVQSWRRGSDAPSGCRCRARHSQSFVLHDRASAMTVGLTPKQKLLLNEDIATLTCLFVHRMAARL